MTRRSTSLAKVLRKEAGPPAVVLISMVCTCAHEKNVAELEQSTKVEENRLKSQSVVLISTVCTWAHEKNVANLKQIKKVGKPNS